MPQASTRGAGRSVAIVIAPPVASEEAARILHTEGLEAESFASVEDLERRSPGRAVALVLLYVVAERVSLAGAVAQLARRFEQTPLVLVCAGARPRDLRAALAAGAWGVVLSDELCCALGPCIGAVRAGQVCLPRANWQAVKPLVLSSREKQILGLVVMGYMNSQIAAQLYLAESTVKSHLSSAFVKLGVRSRHEAAARILDPESGLGVGILTLASEPLPVPVADAR
jgi:DNA-binding NarL/FixJ family response regulator